VFSLSVLTEASLRILLKDADLEAMEEYCVDSGVIVTPSARSWLMENKIDLVIGGKCVVRAGKPQAGKSQVGESQADKPKRIVGTACGPEATAVIKNEHCCGMGAGCKANEKPEHMTALRGNTLVCKTHGIISFRGKLDSLMAKILEVQLAFKRLDMQKSFDDLGETLDLARSIMRAEVMGETLEPVCLFGMDEAELRSCSHTPKRCYDMPHFFASANDGEAIVLLNSLRAASREVELEACRAFKTDSGESARPDIIRALNRLSSAFYVLMFRVKAEECV